MSLVSNLLNQKIDYIYSVSKNRYSDTTRTEQYTNVSCRWQEKVIVVTDKKGEEKEYVVEVWLLPSYSDIEEGWEISNNSETYIVGAVGKMYDLAGNMDHIKLFLE